MILIIYNNIIDYLYIVYCNGLITLTNCPTSVTRYSANLNEHIFSTTYENNGSMYQITLVTDVNDHILCFILLNWQIYLY